MDDVTKHHFNNWIIIFNMDDSISSDNALKEEISFGLPYASHIQKWTKQNVVRGNLVVCVFERDVVDRHFLLNE